MITWDELVYDLNELCKLENGGGSEIEFEYNGNEYVIVCYKNECSFALIIDPYAEKYVEKIYGSMEALGASNDFGFCLKDVWEKIEFPLIKPDFDEVGLQVILDAYKEAWNKRRRHK